jgi:hypothetical protein
MTVATSVMTERERYVAALTFGNPDRVPFSPGWGRKSTREVWYKQGLAEGRDPMEALREALGLPRPRGRAAVSPGVSFRMIPTFEEKVLEHKDGHYIVQDWMGNITEISDQYDYTYIRNAIDFVTRKWHKFPVENRADFEAMKKRYDPAAPDRFPEDFRERCRKLKDRDYPAAVSVAGPFWQMREWCGFEPLCMFFIDDPDFIAEMAAFWTEFVSRTLAPLLDAGVLDAVHFSEDMAYKEKSMISPAMAREFLLPAWSRWTGEIRGAGVPVVDMDSDGRIDELIPLWIEAGINVCDPIEVAAGNDLNEFRRTFGRKMAYTGGVDKRAMAKGGEVIVKEIERIAPVVKDGGYIPSCDHGVPPDVSWPDFVRYSRLLAEVTGWL